MKKLLITEKDVLAAARSGSLAVPDGALITALARDTAKARKVQFVRPAETPGTVPAQTPVAGIVIASDHGGFSLKTELIPFLSGKGFQVEDLGPATDAAVDYPDFAYAVGLKVKSNPGVLGIMIDGAGIGSSMALNKIPGILAACCHNEFTARNARQHNHANVLTLGSKAIGAETAKTVVSAFLASIPEPGRHEARVNKIREIENRFSKG
ncbi:MAG: RpiB/LacA/LacB family sugar-phosphate isomerase [Bacteroidetes bacterium]|nr:RpiB/LacA/LacB family sugar-phosphate isomerase [Bacteroidota bacterium]